MEIVLLIFIIPLAAWCGYKVGIYHIKKENDTLRTQVSLLQNYSDHWAAESTNRYSLYGQVAQQQSHNTTATMQTVIHLLNTIKREQGQNLTSNENEKISQLINQAKQVIQN